MTADSHPDDGLRDALAGHDRDHRAEMPDYQSVFSLMAGSMRPGGFRPYFVLGVVLTTLVTALCVVAVVQVFRADTTKLQILWSLAAVGAYIWVGLAKVWLWTQFERRALLIELKRTELRIMAALDRASDTDR